MPLSVHVNVVCTIEQDQIAKIIKNNKFIFLIYHTIQVSMTVLRHFFKQIIWTLLRK